MTTLHRSYSARLGCDRRSRHSFASTSKAAGSCPPASQKVATNSFHRKSFHHTSGTKRASVTVTRTSRRPTERVYSSLASGNNGGPGDAAWRESSRKESEYSSWLTGDLSDSAESSSASASREGNGVSYRVNTASSPRAGSGTAPLGTSASQKDSQDFFSSLSYWAQVALLNDRPDEQTVDFFERTSSPNEDCEVVIANVPSCGQRIFVYLNHTAREQVVSIRGSKNARNMRTNLKFKPIEVWGTPGAEVHRGFYQVAMELEKELAPYVQVGYSTSLTGHSAGGVVAVLLALHYHSHGHRIRNVVTFGAPKVGTPRFAEMCRVLPVVRVVAKDDVIPLLPPAAPPLRRGAYCHVGEAVVVDDAQPGLYARVQGPEAAAFHCSTLDTLPAVLGRVTRVARSNLERLQSHRMARYMDTLQKLEASNTEVSVPELCGYTLVSDITSRRLIYVDVPDAPLPEDQKDTVTSSDKSAARRYGISKVKSRGPVRRYIARKLLAARKKRRPLSKRLRTTVKRITIKSRKSIRPVKRKIQSLSLLKVAPRIRFKFKQPTYEEDSRSPK